MAGVGSSDAHPNGWLDRASSLLDEVDRAPETTAAAAAELARSAADPAVASIAWRAAGIGLRMTGRLGEALGAFDAAIEAAERCGDQQLAGLARTSRAAPRFITGDMAGGLDDLRFALAHLDGGDRGVAVFQHAQYLDVDRGPGCHRRVRPCGLAAARLGTARQVPRSRARQPGAAPHGVRTVRRRAERPRGRRRRSGTRSDSMRSRPPSSTTSASSRSSTATSWRRSGTSSRPSAAPRCSVRTRVHPGATTATRCSRSASPARRTNGQPTSRGRARRPATSWLHPSSGSSPRTPRCRSATARPPSAWPPSRSTASSSCDDPDGPPRRASLWHARP